MSLRAAAIRADRVVTFVASFLSGGVLMAMSVLVAALVVARYGFSSPIFWGEEMARFLMFYLVMIGAAVALRHNQHPRLTMLLTALPPRGRVVVEVLIDTAVFGTLIVLFFHGLDSSNSLEGRCRISTRIRSGSARIDALRVAVPSGDAEHPRDGHDRRRGHRDYARGR